MKEVLAHIEKKKQEFARLPLFEYMRDTSIEPQQRLAWTPYITPLTMGFGDLWAYILKREANYNKIQEMLNKHADEDKNHWKWFPKDIKALGFNQTLDFSDSIKFVWSEETTKARLLILQIAILTHDVEPEILAAAIEALEATANVVFSTTAIVVNDLKKITSKNYPYFGSIHLLEDTTHSMFEEDNQEFIENIKLTETQINESYQIVDELFSLFTECLYEIGEIVFVSNKKVHSNIELIAS